MRNSFPYDENDKTLNFLYRTVVGRAVLKLLTQPFISHTAGFFMNRKISAAFVPKFIKKNNIDMNDYNVEKYTSFNNFFTRHIADGKRPVSPDGLISPSDSLLTIYDIDDESRFKIKGRTYSMSELLSCDTYSREFAGGKCLVFRLTVGDYHRYCYIDNGTKGDNIFIKGVLHTVQPIACGESDVYKENCREYTVMQTDNLGKVIQIEVGAMMVGKICNLHTAGTFRRGEEKGYFEFGGSTIVVLLKKDTVIIDEEIIQNTANGLETRVRCGEKIGEII